MSSMSSTTRTPPSKNYLDLIANDALAPARLFWVERNGKMARRAWEELTATEKFFQNEADRRAYELSLFNPCDWEG